MKITFVNPVLGGDFSALDIAITTLATIVNKKGTHKAAILDFTFRRKQWRRLLREHIARHRPDAIGFSVNSLYLQFIKEISKEVKRISPKTKVLYGGYHASVHPEELFNLSYCDVLVVGDADDTICKILDSLNSPDELARISGVWIKAKGKETRNPGHFFSDLDSLPYLDWSLWKDLDKYFYFLGMLYQIGTRGCTYNCTFCESCGIKKAIPGRYFRSMSPKRLAEELAWQWNKYQNKGLKLIQLFDQIPTMNREWLKEFCKEYKKAADTKKQKYSMFSRVDHLDEEKIRLLSDSGCEILRLGVESGNEKIRNLIMNKQLSTQKVREVFRLTKKYGIRTTAYFILGAPGESKATLRQTLSLAKEIKSDRSVFFVFKPFTDESKELVIKEGGKINLRKSKTANNISFDAVIDYPGLSSRHVEMFQAKAYSQTLPRRIGVILRKQNLKYIINFFRYVLRGLALGMDFKYLITYYHVYGFDIVHY
jgi:magnesium-protoporphyrin IX monomethyl ester (oxidative) cyclase